MNHAKALVLAFILFASTPLAAQQITRVPGLPSATTTIDGKQLPPPSPKFGGVIKEDAKDSKPYWPPTVVPPKGAPNVLLIMTDDQGYGVSGTFGGVIPTPAMGFGKGGTGVLSVDGKELSRQKMEHTIPILMFIDESFDVGIDTRTGVDDSYKLPFRFNGKINKLTFNLGREQLTAQERDEMMKALARARD
jgi:hypothetical protein